MKILFWADGFWPRIGGAETFGLRFVEGMQKRGHECLVLAQQHEPHGKRSGIAIHRFDFDAFLEKRDLKGIRKIQEGLEEIAREFQPDIIFLNTLARGSALVFLLFRHLFHAPFIARAHSPYWNAVPARVVELCHAASQVCCVSNWVLNTMGPGIHNLKLIYNGLPMPQLLPTPLPFSPPILLLLGRLSIEKGFDTAIEAFSLLKKGGSNARLLIAGEGNERPFLEHLAGKLQVAIEFTSAVSTEEVASVINQATLVVMPSHFEAFGFVAIEAMQMGRPVIASDVGGLREIVVHGETGLLVPPQNPEALYLAIQSLLELPTQVLQMGVKGRERAMEKFSLEANLNAYEECMEAIHVAH